MSISSNLGAIKDKIKESAARANIDYENIHIIAVTKTVDIDQIMEAMDSGIENIGENRVQELTRKYDVIKEEVKWHLIGHLQKNKVKYIIDKVELIHSLDSYELAKEINRRAGDIEKRVNCLVQVNVSGEETKYGIDPKTIIEFLKEIEEFEYVQVVGLMTIAPYTENKEDTRVYFRKLKEIFDYISTLDYKNSSMKYLSMGMSNDYEVAIEEGANLVRIGSAIFGEREY